MDVTIGRPPGFDWKHTLGWPPGLMTLVPLLRVTRAHLEPDGRALEAKSLANLIFKEPLKREVQLDIAVGKQHKRGWRHRGLGHVEDAYALRHRHRSPLKIDLVEEAVHLPGGQIGRAH